MRFGVCFAIMLCLATVATPSAAQSAQPPAIHATAATLWFSEQFVLHSTNVGRDFLIQVSMPERPVPGRTPAVFLLDGNVTFGTAAAMFDAGGMAEAFEPAFVVGISYPGATRQDWLRLRQIDLTYGRLPVMPGRPEEPAGTTGGGAAFARFLTSELRPVIEARYHSNPHRAILVGHSLGGLFVTHLLLNSLGAFYAYLIGSPSLWGEPGLLEQAGTFVAPTRTEVVIGVGESEALLFNDSYHMVGNASTLAALLRRREANIDLTFQIVPEVGHMGVIPTLFQRGFHLLLGPPGRP